MSVSNISKSVLSTPRGTPKEEGDILNPQQAPVPVRFKVEQAVDEARAQMLKEGHFKRLKSLRKELDYLGMTAWKHEGIEKFVKF